MLQLEPLGPVCRFAFAYTDTSLGLPSSNQQMNSTVNLQISEFLNAEETLEREVDGLVEATVAAMQQKQLAESKSLDLELELENLKSALDTVTRERDKLKQRDRNDSQRWKAELEALHRKKDKKHDREPIESPIPQPVDPGLQLKIQRLTEELDLVRRESEECQSLLRESDALYTATVQDYDVQLKSLEDQLKMLEAKVELSEENESRLESEAQRWQQEYSRVAHEMSRLQHAHSEKDNLINQLHPLADKLEQQVNLRQQLEQKCDELTTEVKSVWVYADSLEKRIEDGDDALNQKLAEVEQLHYEVQERDALIEALQTRREPRVDGFAHLETERQLLDDETRKLEEQVQQSFFDMQTLRETTNAKIQSLVDENNVLRESIAQFEEHIAGRYPNHSFVDRVKDMTTDSNRDSWIMAEQEYQELHAQLVAAKEEAASLEQRLTKAEELERQYVALQHDHNQVCQDADVELKRLRKELDEVCNSKLRRRLQEPVDETMGSVGYVSLTRLIFTHSMSRIDEILNPNTDKMEKLLDKLNTSHHDLRESDEPANVVHLVQEYIERVDQFLVGLKETTSGRDRLENDLQGTIHS